MLGEARGGETGRRSTAAVRERRARGGRCSGSGLQRAAPDEAAGDGGPWRQRGAARWARWPCERRERRRPRRAWGRRERRGSGGEGRERRRGREVSGGEWERGPRRRGELAPLSSPSPARGCGGDGPCSDPGRGNREGGEWERWAGPGVGPVGPEVQWGEGLLFFSFSLSVLFSVFFLFVYFLFCFISFKSI